MVSGVNRKPKDLLAFVLSVSMTAYAAWQQLQLLALAGLVAALAIIYKPTVVRVAEILLDLLGRTTLAKYGTLEVQVGTEALGTTFSAGAPLWMRDILSNASASHIGLIVAISTSDRLAVTNGLLKRLRQLRDFGLLAHDGPGISTSSWVWLNPAGREVASYLLHRRGTSSDAVPEEVAGPLAVATTPSNQPLQPTSGAVHRADS
jgi:hypothetical protein